MSFPVESSVAVLIAVATLGPWWAVEQNNKGNSASAMTVAYQEPNKSENVNSTVGGEDQGFEPPSGPTVEARSLLAEALEKTGDDNLDLAQKCRILNDAVSKAAGKLRTQSPAADALVAAATPSDEIDPARAFAAFQFAVTKVLADLSFEPVAEAELPQGFPTYTPVGAIEIKQYPDYRKAAGDGFWKLFAHIQANGIEMTAPVEMTFATDDQDNLSETKMAFLYGDKNVGAPGRNGLLAKLSAVDVVDQDSQTVFALGLRGRRLNENLADARRRLMAAIDANSKYVASGPLRVMGYNSPFVPEVDQFFEVQIPVRLAEPAD